LSSADGCPRNAHPPFGSGRAQFGADGPVDPPSRRGQVLQPRIRYAGQYPTAPVTSGRMPIHPQSPMTPKMERMMRRAPTITRAVRSQGASLMVMGSCLRRETGEGGCEQSYSFADGLVCWAAQPGEGCRIPPAGRGVARDASARGDVVGQKARRRSGNLWARQGLVAFAGGIVLAAQLVYTAHVVKKKKNR